MISGHPVNAGSFPLISKGIPTVISQKTVVFSSFRKIMKNPEISTEIEIGLVLLVPKQLQHSFSRFRHRLFSRSENRYWSWGILGGELAIAPRCVAPDDDGGGRPGVPILRRRK